MHLTRTADNSTNFDGVHSQDRYRRPLVRATSDPAMHVVIEEPEAFRQASLLSLSDRTKLSFPSPRLAILPVAGQLRIDSPSLALEQISDSLA